MLNIHATISELYKGNEAQVVAAYAYHPPLIFVLEIIQAWKE